MSLQGLINAHWCIEHLLKSLSCARLCFHAWTWTIWGGWRGKNEFIQESRWILIGLVDVSDKQWRIFPGCLKLTGQRWYNGSRERLRTIVCILITGKFFSTPLTHKSNRDTPAGSFPQLTSANSCVQIEVGGSGAVFIFRSIICDATSPGNPSCSAIHLCG